MRKGSKNGNWKGGITKFRTADELLNLPENVQHEVRKRLVRSLSVSSHPPCWTWTKKVFNNGRPRLTLGVNFLASRLVYVLWKGKTRGLCVLHSCDNILCVNPDHLWLGTNADNSADMVSKGRQATGDKNGSRLHPGKLIRGKDHLNSIHPERVQGEKNGRATLTNDQVKEIRLRFRPYANCRRPSNAAELSLEFGVTKNIILLIGKGKTWRSV